MAKGDLTDKQRAFVNEYLIDRNATQAAIRAGYSAKTADRIGPKLVGKSCVAKAVEAATKRLSIKAERSALDVVRDLQETAQEARETLNFPAAVKAYEIELKHYGGLTEKVEHSVCVASTMTPAEARRELLRAHGLEDHDG